MTTRKRLTKWLFAFAGAQALAFLAGLSVWWSTWFNLYRLTSLTNGRVYRSAEMSPEVAAMWCKELGIGSVIDFRTQTDKAEAEARAVAKVGARHFHLPSNQVPREAVVKRYLRILDDESNYPVLIHCTHGVGRAGVFSALYRMEYEGWTNERARLESWLLSGWNSFRLRTPKGKFLEAYPPRASDRTY